MPFPGVSVLDYTLNTLLAPAVLSAQTLASHVGHSVQLMFVTEEYREES